MVGMGSIFDMDPRFGEVGVCKWYVCCFLALVLVRGCGNAIEFVVLNSKCMTYKVKDKSGRGEGAGGVDTVIWHCHELNSQFENCAFCPIFGRAVGFVHV